MRRGRHRTAARAAAGSMLPFCVNCRRCWRHTGPMPGRYPLPRPFRRRIPREGTDGAQGVPSRAGGYKGRPSPEPAGTGIWQNRGAPWIRPGRECRADEKALRRGVTKDVPARQEERHGAGCRPFCKKASRKTCISRGQNPPRGSAKRGQKMRVPTARVGIYGDFRTPRPVSPQRAGTVGGQKANTLQEWAGRAVPLALPCRKTALPLDRSGILCYTYCVLHVS